MMRAKNPLFYVLTRLLIFLAVVIVWAGCSQVDSPEPTSYPLLKELRVPITQTKTTFSLNGYVNQSLIYVVQFLGLRRGQVIPALSSDSLKYQKVGTAALVSDSGSYVVCYGAHCDTAKAVFIVR
jgi:hypothetical protein